MAEQLAPVYYPCPRDLAAQCLARRIPHSLLWKMAKWLFPEIALVRGRQRIQEQAYRRAFQARAFRPDNPVSMVGRKLCTGARQSCARIG